MPWCKRLSFHRLCRKKASKSPQAEPATWHLEPSHAPPSSSLPACRSVATPKPCTSHYFCKDGGFPNVSSTFRRRYGLSVSIIWVVFYIRHWGYRGYQHQSGFLQWFHDLGVNAGAPMSSYRQQFIHSSKLLQAWVGIRVGFGHLPVPAARDRRKLPRVHSRIGQYFESQSASKPSHQHNSSNQLQNICRRMILHSHSCIALHLHFLIHWHHIKTRSDKILNLAYGIKNPLFANSNSYLSQSIILYLFF